MSFILKTYNGDKPLYFYKLCRRVYHDQRTPAFKEEIEDAYVFDTRERACNMLTLICGMHPELTLEVEELKHNLRGPDGYVPLENTVKAMLSEDMHHRLWAEYEQLNTRRHLLKEYRKQLNETMATPYEKDLADEQIKSMHDYMISILDRCRFMGIDLSEVEKEIEP